MNNKHNVFTLVMLSIFSPSSAFAESEKFAYFGAKVGYNLFSGDCFESYTECEDDSLGYGIFAGYQFNSWLAAEIDAVDYGNYDAFNQVSRVEDDIRGYALSLKFSQSISDNLDAYLRVGGSYMNSNREANSQSGWSPVGALGVAYYITSNWIFRPEYQYIADVDERGSHFASLGLSYRFGQSSAKPSMAYEIEIEPVKPVEQTKPVEQAKPVTEFVLQESAPEINAEEIFISEPIRFSNNSSILSRKAKVELQRLAEFVKDKQNTKVWLKGYTDDTGPLHYNQWLSQRRAHSAGSFLDSLGVKNIYMKGKGVARPSIRTKNAQDRKVVVSVTLNNTELEHF